MSTNNNLNATKSTELVSTATGTLSKTTSSLVCDEVPSSDNGLAAHVPERDNQVPIVQKHESKRMRTPTEKGLQYQIDSKTKLYQTALRKWHREFDNANDNLADSDDIQSLSSCRTRIVSAFEELQLASFNLAEVSEVPEPILRFENETRQLRHSFNERIKSLKGVSSTGGSKVSKAGSQKSKATSYGSKPAQLEAAVKAAEYEVQLRLHDDEQRQKAALMQQKATLLQQEAELAKLQLQKQLQIERAKLKAIKEDQSDFSMPSDLFDEQDSQQKVQQYLDSVPAVGNGIHDDQIAPAANLAISIPVSNIHPTGLVGQVESTSQPPLNENQGLSSTVARNGNGGLPTTCTTTVVSMSRPIMSSAIGNAPLTQNTSKPDMANLATVLTQQMSLNRLPPPEPIIFTGNPLEFQSWKRSFDLLIDRSFISPAEKLYYLCRYVSGEAKNCINGYLLETSDASYFDAKQRLEERFGDPFVIADSYRKKLKEWPKVNRTGSDLVFLSDFLKQLQSAKKTNQHLDILDDCRENQMILTKLPDWVITRWAAFVEDERTPKLDKNTPLAIKSQVTRLPYPGFSKFADFIAKQAKIAADPVLSLQVIRELNSSIQEKTSRSQHARSFSTQGIESKEDETSQAFSEPSPSVQPSHSFNQLSEERQGNRNKKCYYCKEEHFLSRCKQFRKISTSDRVQYLRHNNMCFRCLSKGHNARDCRKTMITCIVCQGPHHSLTHSDPVIPASVHATSGENTASNTNPDALVQDSVEQSYVHRVDTPNK